MNTLFLLLFLVAPSPRKDHVDGEGDDHVTVLLVSLLL